MWALSPNGAPIDTSTVGSHSFTVTGTDKAGNVTTKTVHYTVVYRFNGFFKPVTNESASKLNLVHAGDLVKIGFGLGGNQGLNIGSFSSTAVTCPGSWFTHSVKAAGAGATPELSFGVASGQYSYGWQTNTSWAGTCRRFSLQLNDGSTPHTAIFLFFS